MQLFRKYFFKRAVYITLLLSASLSGISSAQPTPANCKESCDWFSNTVPLCEFQMTDWGYENDQSCISRNACTQPWNTGGIVQTCDTVDDAALCASLVGTRYFSDDLFQIGLPPNNKLGHQQIWFDETTLNATETDVVYGGVYTCLNGAVIAALEANSNYVLDFNNDFSSLNFDKRGGDNPISYSLSNASSTNCRVLIDQHYTLDSPTGANYQLHFGDPNVIMRLPEGDFPSGFYDCDSGALHLHRDSNDTSPLTASIEGEGDAVVVTLNAQTQWRFVADDPQVCPNLYEPVCAVELQDIVCFTEPCPVGVYKTYANECVADISRALLVAMGECGTKEGQPYYDSDCNPGNSPVCTAYTLPEPCLASPCPIQQYITYPNSCIAQEDQAAILFDGRCEGLEGERIFDLSDMGGCTGVWQPVCAKQETNIVCITEPCPSHEYMTFGNACEAELAVSDIAWSNQGCGEFEGPANNAAPPVELRETLDGNRGQVISAVIQNSILTVRLRHTGCEEHHFNLQVEQQFSGSGPYEVRWSLVPAREPDTSCMAYQEPELQFDLLPLRYFFEDTFGKVPGTIVLPDLAEYALYQELPPEATLDVTHVALADVDTQISINLHGSIYGETTPVFPEVVVADPAGAPLNLETVRAVESGSPWQFSQSSSFIAQGAGEYTVTVIWSAAPQFDQTSSITVQAAASGDCDQAGVSPSNVPEYPNWPNFDWKGDPYNANYDDLMSYQGEVYRALWWTTAIPGSDMSWEFVCTL